MKKVELKRWEITVVALSALLFGTSFTVYVTGFPLRNYLFGLKVDEAQDEVGKVASTTGTLKREQLGHAEFKIIKQNDALFQRDTVVTSGEGGATLTLSDGSTIELGPKTMVKLEGESQFNLTGVARTTRIAVVSGQITPKNLSASSKGRVLIEANDEVVELDESSKVIQASNDRPVVPRPRAAESLTSGFGGLLSRFSSGSNASKSLERMPTDTKPTSDAKASQARPTPNPIVLPSPRPTPSPTPSPSPTPQMAVNTSIQLMEPTNGAKLKAVQTTTGAGKPLILKWRINASDSSESSERKNPVKVSVYRINEKGHRDGNPLLDQSVVTQLGTMESLTWTAKAPGVFECEVLDTVSKKSARSRFTVEKAFEGIQLARPEVLQDGSEDDIQTRGKRVAKVRLSWKAFPSATGYKLRLIDRMTGESQHQDIDVNGTEYTVTQQSASQNNMIYEVATTLPNGFVARSIKDQFFFDFLPPQPSSPTNQTVVSRMDMRKWEGGVLLTWQKTTVSEGYVLEVAADQDFQKVLVKKQLKDNFIVIRPSASINDYWWRVTAQSGQLFSRPSAAFEFKTEALRNTQAASRSH